MNELKLIKQQEILGKDFKVYGDVENPFFKASDVAEWIDYAWKDSRHVNRDVSKMLSLVDEDEKVKCALSLGGENYSHGGLRENTEIWFLTENGLYEVLMLSRKPIAKAFKKEVKKVLHSLRVNGGYIAGQEQLSEDEIIANALVVAHKILAKREATIAEMKPKVDFYNKVTGSPDTCDMKEVAKILNYKNVGRNKLFEILRDEKILDNHNQPYQKYIDAGYFRVIETKFEDKDGDTHINLKTVVFQKGVDYIKKTLDKLQKRG